MYAARPQYTWERVYLAEVSKQLAIPERQPAQAGRLVRIEPNQLRGEGEMGMPGMPVQTMSNARITIRYGDVSVEPPAPSHEQRDPFILPVRV